MTVLRNDKVILTKEMGNMKTVGEMYEVANITDSSIVLRDCKTKVAVGAISIADFNEYFCKITETTKWTPWTKLVDMDGKAVAFYRTNYKKVQVRNVVPTVANVKTFRAEASCNKNDEFNLYFGLQLAFNRMRGKYLKQCENDFVNALDNVRKDIYLNDKNINKILASLEKAT